MPRKKKIKLEEPSFVAKTVVVPEIEVKPEVKIEPVIEIKKEEQPKVSPSPSCSGMKSIVETQPQVKKLSKAEKFKLFMRNLATSNVTRYLAR